MKNTPDVIVTKIRNSLKRPTTKRGRVLVSVIAFAFIGTIVIAFSKAAVPTATIEPEAGSATLAGCVAKTIDATASEGGAVKFGCSGSGVLGLDNSGKTIPQTNYAIPAGAIYISPAGSDKNSNSVDGNDSNNGLTIDKPVKTINTAITKVPSGGTIVMRGGEYRDWHNSGSNIIFEGKSFNLQAYPSESPWFNGADVVSTGWASAGTNIWSRTWETPDFCGPGQYYLPVEGGKTPFAPNLTSFATSCVYGDSVKDSTTVAGDPQNVIINGKKLAQVPSKAQVNANTFFYDWNARKMYIGQNPTSNTVELAKRTQAFMLNKGDYAIKGIGFKNYASGGSGGGNWTINSTVFINEPKSSVIENSVFVDNSYAGLGYSRPKDGKSSITNSVFAYNGYAGLHANGSRSAGGRDDFTIEGNVFNTNNDQSFDIKCSGACGAANVKFNNMIGFTAKNNIVENAKAGGYGLWCDINCNDGVMVNNRVINNAKVGIFYEISQGGIIASNLVVDNGQDGIGVTAANTKVYNNTVVFDRGSDPQARGINIFDDNRASICWGDPGIGPDTKDVELANNVVYAKNGGELSASIDSREVGGRDCPPNTTTNTKASEFYNVFDYNAYHRNASNAAFYVWRYDNGNIDFGIRSTAAFTNATGWDSHSIDESGSTDTFFKDQANGDYTLKTNSQPYTNKGKAIPADVAAKLGIPANSVLPRGAISWPQ